MIDNPESKSADLPNAAACAESAARYLDLPRAMLSIPLSIIVATTRRWPAVRDCLAHLCHQAQEAGAEIILADGSGYGVSGDFIEQGHNIRWLKVPGASVFELRARAVVTAQGEVIALTEDHCLVAPDWCERILVAHEEHPDALAVGGAVENGSMRLAIDKANFFLTFAPFVPPLGSRPIERAPTPANISYKRRAIPNGSLEPGWVELVLNPGLCASKAVVLDDRIRVTHVQSHGFLGTCAAHFHNGRSTAGLVLESLTPGLRRKRLRRCIFLPYKILRETTSNLKKRSVPRLDLIVGIPLVALLAVCHAAGELTGLIKGPGRSPRRLT